MEVSSKGGMTDGIFRRYIEDLILPLYPNISPDIERDTDGKIIKGPVILKTDSGPGRFREDLEHIDFLDKCRKLGFIILLSLPNATSVSAELDQFFGVYKGWCHTRTLNHFSEKLQIKIEELNKQRQIRSVNSQVNDLLVTKDDLDLTRREEGDNSGKLDTQLTKVKCVVGLDNDDLAVMINGKPNDPLEMRPFDRCFQKDRILSAWHKVGFIPFTRSCLQNPKVRHELGEGTKESIVLAQLQKHYNEATRETNILGFNNVFNATIPQKKVLSYKVKRSDRVSEMVSKKQAFSCSGIYFINMGSMVANSSEVLEAQRCIIDDKNKRDEIKLSKDKESHTLRRQQAIQCYYKFNNGETMNLSEWKSIARWILPQVGEKAPSKFSTKKLIIERLERIENGWKRYFTNEINQPAGRVSMMEPADENFGIDACNLEKDMTSEINQSLQPPSLCPTKHTNTCDYPNCDGVLPLEICGDDLCINYTHHLCQNKFDDNIYDGTFEQKEGIIKRCKKCFIEMIQSHVTNN